MRLTLYYREVSKLGYVFHGKPFPRRDVAKVVRFRGQRVKSIFIRDLPPSTLVFFSPLRWRGAVGPDAAGEGSWRLVV